MIHQISSDLKTFKTLNFEAGLNILLADKSENATDRHTRNGAGKSSLVDLINFLCASKADAKNIFRSDKLKNSNFNMVVDINGKRCTVGRSGKKPAILQINDGAHNWPILPQPNKITKKHEISNENWKQVLREVWFGFKNHSNTDTKYQPTFRSLVSYFARRQESGGFQTHVQHAKMQQTWDWQVALSYLLGLDWHISQNFQTLRDEKAQAKNLKLMVDSGGLDVYFEQAGVLRSKLVAALQRVERLRDRLDTFQVIPEYRERELEANKITGKISQDTEENFIDRRIIDELNLTLEEEDVSDSNNLIKLYEEAQVVLPDSLQKRLDDVKKFHKTIIENRKSHLIDELNSIKERVKTREKNQENLDLRRRQIMEMLQSGGALEQYTLMHGELGRAEAEVAITRKNLNRAETLERSKAKLGIEQNRLTEALLNDIHERNDFLNEAIGTFEKLSQSLYEQAGSLIIGAGNSGPTFDIKIDGQRSKGINNMQIFCFDLMLMELCTARGQSPGFLVHDSHLFDGVDERQVAKALQLGAERAEKAGFQYIITMNSDEIPKEGFDQGFNVNDYVLRTKLTDKTDDGGLFGIRF